MWGSTWCLAGLPSPGLAKLRKRWDRGDPTSTKRKTLYWCCQVVEAIPRLWPCHLPHHEHSTSVRRLPSYIVVSLPEVQAMPKIPCLAHFRRASLIQILGVMFWLDHPCRAMATEKSAPIVVVFPQLSPQKLHVCTERHEHYLTAVAQPCQTCSFHFFFFFTLLKN